MHTLLHVGLLQVRASAPRNVVHRHALSLQLTTSTAVDDHQLTGGEPLEDNLGYASCRVW